MKPNLRIIGDVHGKLNEYIPIADEAQHSIQLGDLGFKYDPITVLDSDRHKVLGGNHDNYELVEGQFINQTPHFLGDFGVHTVPEVGDFFFVRGGYSIDKAYRTEGVSWWPGEQLSYAQGYKAYEKYQEVRPDLMLSHECPEFVIDMVSGSKVWDGEVIRPSMTAKLLQQMFEIHQPKMWFFGHHHRTFEKEVNGTMFICLPELDYIDLVKDGDKWRTW